MALGAGLALAALLAWPAPRDALDWQPALAWSQPWRLLTAAWVHWSPAHLGVNLAAAAVVAAYGGAAGVPARAALAWACSWPLAHALLALRPDLAHYGGLSGGLHGGVCIVSVWLMVRAQGRRRWIGAAVMAGLVLKLVSEAPWGPTLRWADEWGIAVAPVAHATGALAGLLTCAALWHWGGRARHGTRR